MDINQKIGTHIKSIRLEKKRSREWLARKVGVVQQTIEKYEKGEINISVEKLVKIACALGICITDFLKDEEMHEHFKKILLK